MTEQREARPARFRFEIPAAARGQKGRRYLHWDCRGESTVYIDGKPWAGIDPGGAR